MDTWGRKQYRDLKGKTANSILITQKKWGKEEKAMFWDIMDHIWNKCCPNFPKCSCVQPTDLTDISTQVERKTKKKPKEPF